MSGHPETRSLLDGARRAQSLGFDSIWVGDSLLARPRHDPLTLLAAVAAAVPDVELGPAVLLPALRNPVVLAHQLATLDQLSEGRLILGVGIAGDTPAVRAEFTAAGVPFEGRVGRLMEGLRLSKALWSGDPVSWDGRWQVDEGSLAPVPHHPGGPPVWLAAGADVGIERAAKHYDGWFPIGPDARRSDSANNSLSILRSRQGEILQISLLRCISPWRLAMTPTRLKRRSTTTSRATTEHHRRCCVRFRHAVAARLDRFSTSSVVISTPALNILCFAWLVITNQRCKPWPTIATN